VNSTVKQVVFWARDFARWCFCYGRVVKNNSTATKEREVKLLAILADVDAGRSRT